MRSHSAKLLPLALATIVVLGACGETAKLPASAGFGPSPTLPPPNRTLLPTVAIAKAVGWQPGEAPTAMAGLAVRPFATGLQHPRWLHVLPNGDVLVAESDAPPKPAETGLKAWITALLMKRAGSGTPSANRITLLRDADGDGAAELRTTFIEGLNSPFGMALIGSDLYVANTDAVVRFAYAAGQTRIEAPGQRVVELPAGPRNHHWTKALIASPDGTRLYATVGSNSNVAENGLEAEAGRAAVWEIDPKGRTHRVFASGLRNPNGMAFEPGTGRLWTVVNERDEIGSDLVPDYLTSLQSGGFYGWPYSYYGAHLDDRVKPQRPDLVASAIVPDYALGAHTASLGLAHSQGFVGGTLPVGMFIGQHGSWNRKPPSGYKVVHVAFAGGRPSGPPVDVLTGFLSAAGEARGRPVGVAVDTRGGLLVADDVGNAVWRLDAAAPR